MVNTGIGNIAASAGAAVPTGKAAQVATESLSASIAENLVSKGGEAIAGLLSGINKAMPSILPTATAALATLSFRGSQGNFATLKEDITLRGDFLSISGLDRENRGTPVYRRMMVGDLSGFAQFQDVHIAISDGMTVTEAEALEQLLQSGVFLDWSGM